jgi:hypothetical protein
MELLSYLWKNQKVTRLVTVLRNLPFYRSTGINSRQPNTWFPFSGIDETTQWLIKPPKKTYLSKQLLAKWKQIGCDSEVNLFRFGSMPTLCMSASIGGGFWATKKGSLFKEFLDNEIKGVKDYYLDTEIVTHLHEIASSNNINEPITDPNKLNTELKKLKAYLPVGNRYAKTPEAHELKFFTNPDADETIKSVLTSMLVRNIRFNHEKFQNLLIFSKNTAAFDYACKWFYFEDPKMWTKLLSCIKKYGDTLSVEHLKKINCFKALSDNQHILLSKPVMRKAIRTLIESHSFNEEYLLLIKELYNNKILHKYITFLENHKYIDELLILYKTKKLTKANIELIEKPKNESAKNLNVSSITDKILHPKIPSPGEGKLLVLNGLFQNKTLKQASLSSLSNIKKPSP